jgi:hypothetical protein
MAKEDFWVVAVDLRGTQIEVAQEDARGNLRQRLRRLPLLSRWGQRGQKMTRASWVRQL